MPFTLTVMTELDAVNEMLLSIGAAPVNTLSVTGLADVNVAQTILHSVNRSFQTTGWNFNKDSDYTLGIDGNGHAIIPSNCLDIDPTDRFKNYVERNDASDGVRKLWDKDELTYVLTESVDVDVTWFVSFEDMPQAARDYVATRAARQFQASVVSSQILHQFTTEHENEARRIFRKVDRRNKDINMFTKRNSTNNILHRRY